MMTKEEYDVLVQHVSSLINDDERVVAAADLYAREMIIQRGRTIDDETKDENEEYWSLIGGFIVTLLCRVAGDQDHTVTKPLVD